MTNRRNLLLSFLSVPTVIAGVELDELLAPRKTIFLPPRGGWFREPTIWAVRMEDGYYFSHELRALLNDPSLDRYTIITVDRELVPHLVPPASIELTSRRLKGGSLAI